MPDGSGDGSGNVNESSSGDGNGDGNDDDIGEGGGETKKRKKPRKSSRRDVGNGGDLSIKRKSSRQERVRSVATDPDNLENSREAGREAQGPQGLCKNCKSRERVSPLSRLIRGYRNKYHCSNGIGGGRGEAKRRKRPHKSCRRDVGNERDLGGKRKKTADKKGLAQ